MPPEHHRVRLLTKPGCHLCDDARDVVARVCADLGVPWEEQDALADHEVYTRYADEIPVTFVDGEEHDFWRVKEDRLRAALLA